MCDFISYIEKNGEILYLTDKEVFSKFGKEHLKGCLHNDILGHGAIRKFYNIQGGRDVEVKDFWNLDKLPKEIAAKIKEFDKHWGKIFKAGHFQTDDLQFIHTNAPEPWKSKAFKQMLAQGYVRVGNCPGFTGFPDGFTAQGYVYVYDCPGFTGFPDGFTAQGDVYVYNCPGFTGFPDGFTAQGSR